MRKRFTNEGRVPRRLLVDLEKAGVIAALGSLRGELIRAAVKRPPMLLRRGWRLETGTSEKGLRVYSIGDAECGQHLALDLAADQAVLKSWGPQDTHEVRMRISTGRCEEAPAPPEELPLAAAPRALVCQLWEELAHALKRAFPRTALVRVSAVQVQRFLDSPLLLRYRGWRPVLAGSVPEDGTRVYELGDPSKVGQRLRFCRRDMVAHLYSFTPQLGQELQLCLRTGEVLSNRFFNTAQAV